MKLIKFFLEAFYVKRQDFVQTFFLKTVFLWSRYGANLLNVGTGTVTFQKSKPEP
jgi:hypothetical protein